MGIWKEGADKAAAREKTIDELAENKSFYPTPVEIVDLTEDGGFLWSQIAIVPLFDVHSGGVGSNAVRERKAVEFVKKTANAKCIIGGDLFNSIISPGQNQHDDIAGNQDMIRRAKRMYIPLVLQNKLPLILFGNHDGTTGKRNNVSDLSAMSQFYDGLSAYGDVRLAEFGALLKFAVATDDNRRVKEIISIYFNHVSGTDGTTESEYTQAVAWLNERNEIVKAIYGGHSHANKNGMILQEIPQYDKQGRVYDVMHEYALVVSESTLQELARYALASGMSPADSNVYIYDFKMVRNPEFTGTDKDVRPEYVMQCCTIPMFRQGSDEYTEDALRYMQEHMEPDRDKFFADMTRTNSAKIKTRLRNQKENYNTQKFVKSYLRDSIQDSPEEEPQILSQDDGLEKVRG